MSAPLCSPRKAAIAAPGSLSGGPGVWDKGQVPLAVGKTRPQLPDRSAYNRLTKPRGQEDVLNHLDRESQCPSPYFTTILCFYSTRQAGTSNPPSGFGRYNTHCRPNRHRRSCASRIGTQPIAMRCNAFTRNLTCNISNNSLPRAVAKLSKIRSYRFDLSRLPAMRPAQHVMRSQGSSKGNRSAHSA